MLLIAVLLISSCNSEKQAAKKLVKQITKAKDTFAEHPDSFASACAVQFPPQTKSKESITVSEGPVDTIRNKTQTDITYDLISLLQRSNDSTRGVIIDSLLKHPVIIRGDCPPVIVRHDTVKKTTEVQIENTAKIVALTNSSNALLVAATTAETKVTNLGLDVKKKEGTIHLLGGSLIFLLIAIVVYIVLRIKKSII